MTRFYVGVDLHSTAMQVAVMDANGEIMLNRKIPCDLDRFLKLIEPYREGVKVVVESTHNWYWLVDGLRDRGIDVILAHALGIYAITNAKVKTDRNDAATLAELLRLNAIPEAHIVKPDLRELRDLLRRRMNLVQQRTALYASIRSQLVKFNQDRYALKEIRKWTIEGVNALPVPEGYRMHISNCIVRVECTTHQILTIERHLLCRAEEIPAVGAVKSIPGIGDILGMMIVFESGDIFRFPSVKEYASYCRLIPGIAQSMNTVKRGRRSKQGNAYLKWAFTQAAMHGAKHCTEMKTVRDRHLKKRNHKGARMVANCILAHKIARVAMALMKNGGRFIVKTFTAT